MESILEILSYVFWVVLAIMILVFVHEMGHFLFAKLFGMRVERFSIGFPPRIIGKKIGETDYMIGATPLGGYVKIAGMVDESMDTESLEAEPQPWEFRAKPVWQRILVITAGVFFNVVLAFVIYTGLKIAYGDSYIPAENIEEVFVEPSSLAYDMGLRTGDRVVAVNGQPLEQYSDLQGDVGALLADDMSITVDRGGEKLTFSGPEDIMTQLNRTEGNLGISVFPSLIGGIMKGSAAEEAGLQPGDRIVSIEGEPVKFWLEMTDRIQDSAGKPMRIQWERPDSLLTGALAAEGKAEGLGPKAGTRRMEAEVSPRPASTGDGYLLGVTAPGLDLLSREWGVKYKRYGLFTGVAAGASHTWEMLSTIATSLKRVFSFQENFRENVGGPIKIAQYTKEAADAGAGAFWNIVAMLSITLAIMNILPIPALDGGHLVFLIYEGITRREPSLKVRMALQQVGMVVLLLFMTFVIFNDILTF